MGAATADEANRFPAFRFDGEAQNVFIEWACGHHARNEREDNPLIAQHLSKYDKLFPALALIFHLLDIAAGKTTWPGHQRLRPVRRGMVRVPGARCPALLRPPC